MSAINETIINSIYRIFDKDSGVWKKFSWWGKAKDTEFDDGQNAEDKLGAINGITDSLVSDASDIAASAAAVSALNQNLGGLRFGVDEDGNPGYIITDEAGADTVNPFKSAVAISVATTISKSGLSAYNSSGSFAVNISSYYSDYASLPSDWFSYVGKIYADLDSTKYGSNGSQGGDSSVIALTSSYNTSTGVLTVSWKTTYSGYDTSKTWAIKIPIIIPSE